MSKKSKKITTGVEKAYYAILKEDGDTPIYAPATYLQGLREFSIVANEEESSIYAENRLWESENALGAIELTLDFTSIFTEDYVALLGKKLSTTGGIIESVDDQAPYIALMLEKTLSGGVKEYLTLFKGKLRIPEDKGKTKEGSTEFQTQSLNGTFMALNNGQWKHTVKSDDVNFNETNHAITWGKTVVVPTELKATEFTLTNANPQNNAQTLARTGSSIALTFSNQLIDYKVSFKDNAQKEIPVTVALDDTKKILTVKPSGNLDATTKHTLTITSTKDMFGQMLPETVLTYTTVA